MSNRQWYKALGGLWERRSEPAARVILQDALDAAEQLAQELHSSCGRMLADALAEAVEQRQNVDSLLFDKDGRPVAVQIQAQVVDGELNLHLHARYLRHRLYQFVGEPA